MSHRTLREVAKFLAGVVVADLLMLLWFWSNNMFPISIWGVTWTSSVVLPGVVFDIALIIILIHYGWHLGKMPRMKERSYLIFAGCLFTIVALAHLVRIFTGSDIEILNWEVPIWLSWVGVVVTSYLAYSSFFFSIGSRSKR